MNVISFVYKNIFIVWMIDFALVVNVSQLGQGGDFTTNLHTKHRTATFAKPLIAEAILTLRSDLGASLHSANAVVKNKFVKKCSGFVLDYNITAPIFNDLNSKS
ncbi:MAG: hypothetical protein WBP43_09680 [Chitinophagales bacterium]